MRQLWISTSGKSGVLSGRRKDCRKCRIKNHFANRCKEDAKATVESDMYFEETYQTEEILAVRLDDSQLVTLQLESVNFIRFQPDKGAQCNVLPLLVYKRTSNDHNLDSAADDPVQQTPRTVIKRGWPDIKADVPECVYLYFDIREELTVREELIFKC